MEALIKKAQLFIEEALPYLQKFNGKVVVIKYGGKAMQGEELKESVMRDIAMLWFLGLRPVVVHGGGPEITREMEKARLKPRFVRGLRVTDEATVRIIRRVFRRTNAGIRQMLAAHGVPSESIERCLLCKPMDASLGLVGIPVVSPVGVGMARGGKKRFNVNADIAATALAVHLKAEKLTILTDVDGVIINGKLVPHLTRGEAVRRIADGSIHGGMIPKVESCIAAVEAGCRKAHLVNGTVPHSLLFEIFTKRGVGTELIMKEK